MTKPCSVVGVNIIALYEMINVVDHVITLVYIKNDLLHSRELLAGKMQNTGYMS